MPFRPALTLGALLALAILPALAQTGPLPGKTYRVGYSQIVDHPALNATRQGFLDGLKEAGFESGKNLDFEYQNAQGAVGNARMIADKFVADHLDLLAPCTTPNVQATIRVARGTGIPVVFGCVSNPVDSGIVASLTQPTGTNVTGIYTLQPADQMIDVIAELLPKAKTVGILYNGAETNSVSAVALARAEATRKGLAVQDVQVASTADVRAAIDALVGRVDVVFTPQDNTIASAFDAVLKVTRDKGIPLVSLDTTAAQRGALASFGIDQYQSGLAWARQVAVPVLLGRDPATFTPVNYRDFELYLNADAARAAGVTIPEPLRTRAKTIYGQN